MFHTHCATCLHYIAILKITSIRYCKKIPTNVADIPDLNGALSNIQSGIIIVANIRSKKHTVARKECKIIECADEKYLIQTSQPGNRSDHAKTGNLAIPMQL